VALAIRDLTPDVVLAHDPWVPYRLHPDHQAAGHLAVHGIVAARDPHFFPEHGLAPHRPRTLLLFEPARVDHLERVFDHLDRKTDALLAHRSQWRSTMGIDEHDPAGHRDQQHTFVNRVHDEARIAGLRGGVRAAEAFARLDAL
jgi:LmbE family N-acetylglucosaminyl deacetylase